MKLKVTLTLGALAIGFAGFVKAEDPQITVPAAAPAAATAATAVKAAPAYTEAQVLESLGWIAGKQMQLDTFGFTPEQLANVIKGIQLAAAEKDLPYDKEKLGPLINEFVQKKQTEYLDSMKKKAVAETATYFAKLKENKAVQFTASGIGYEILQPGTGAYPKPSDTVKVHYTGKLVNGTVFDSSVERKEPVDFPLDQVIPGWTEGIQKINVGGKIRLHIPPQLAYGDEGRPGIPPGATLIFDVELLEAKPTPGPASMGAPAAAPAPAAPAATK